MKFSENNEEGSCVLAALERGPILGRLSRVANIEQNSLPGVSDHPAQALQMKFSLSPSGKPTHCCPPVAWTAPVTPQP